MYKIGETIDPKKKRRKNRERKWGNGERERDGDVDIGKSKIYIKISNGNGVFCSYSPPTIFSSHLAFTFGVGLRWEVGVNGRCWGFKINFLKIILLLIIIIILTNLFLYWKTTC